MRHLPLNIEGKWCGNTTEISVSADQCQTHRSTRCRWWNRRLQMDL